MSMHLIRTLSVKALFFILVVFLEPNISRAGLFDDEDDLKEGDGRPPTVLQSLVADFEKDVKHIDSVLYCPDTSSRIQAFVLTFMREQGFSIGSEQEGSASRVGVKREFFLERQEVYARDFSGHFSSLSASTVFLNSVMFRDALDDFAYVSLLREWQNKLDPKFPYTHFLEGLNLTPRMLVLCPHPRDIIASRKFLSLLYGALRRLHGIDPTVCVPDHEGLRIIFGVFLKHPDNEERVMKLWGASLLGGMEQFYKEQRFVSGWTYMARILRVSKDEMTRALHDVQIRLSHSLEALERLEAVYNIPSSETIRATLQWRVLPQEAVENILDTWKERIITKIRVPQTQAERSSKYAVLQQERATIEDVENMRLVMREYRFLKAEVSSVEVAFAIAEYFFLRPEIQFVNPFQVKRDLGVLYIEFSQLSSPKSPALIALYRTLKELSSVTFSEIERRIEGGIPRRLPPLSLVPAHLQEELQRAYRLEKRRLKDPTPFAQERRDTRKTFTDFEERVLVHILEHVDTPDKERFVSLQEEAKRRTLKDDERKDLVTLKRAIIGREAQVSSQSAWPIRYLHHRHRADLAELAYLMVVARSPVPSLKWELEKRRFLLWTMEKNNVDARNIKPIQEEAQRLQEDLQAAEARIKDIKECVKVMMDRYNENTQALSAVRVPV